MAEKNKGPWHKGTNNPKFVKIEYNPYRAIFGGKITDENLLEATSEAMYRVLMKINASVIDYELNKL